MRVRAGVLAGSIVLAAVPLLAQGTNGRPRPFETGYFPVYDQPRVVAASAHLEVTTDDRPYTISFPIDGQIVRTVMVRNTSTDRVRVTLSASMSIVQYEPDLFLTHPQPTILYLDPGQSYPVRLQYTINSGPWSVGDTVNVPMTLTVQEESISTGQTFGAPLTATLNTTVSVVRRPNPGALDPDPAANATITGVIRDATTLQPYANTEVLVDTGTAGQLLRTDASGRYSANIFAYKRAGGGSAWRETGVMLGNSAHINDAEVVFVPRAGETTTADLDVPTPRAGLTYTQTASLGIGLAAYAWDAAADGSVIATVPFHSGLNWDVVESRAYVDVFTSTGTRLFRFPLRQETPALDVSDDGQFIATTRRPAGETGPQAQTGGSAIILNRSGQVVLEVPVGTTAMSPWGPESRESRYTEVRLSHDNRYFAIGDGTGWFSMLDRATGRVLWRTFTKGQVRRIDFDSGDARVFVSSGDGYLRAFDLSGNVLWQTWVDSWLTAIDISSHYVLASSKAARQGLHLINKVTGATVWSYQVETIANDVRIAPDESYVWYGTSSGAGGGGSWMMPNAVFSMTGMPTKQLARANFSGADAGTISADSRLVAWVNGCTVNVSDRDGRPLFKSGYLAGYTSNGPCNGQYSHVMWMSSDGSKLVAVVGPRDLSGGGSTIVFFSSPTMPAPTGVTATASGSTVTISWTAPSSGTPDTYVIEAGSATGLSDIASFSTGTAATSFTTTNVPNGTYYIRVRAGSASSVSGASAEAVLVVGAGTCSVPSAPTGLSVVSAGGGAVSLAWSAASGSPTTYIAEAGSSPGATNLANTDLGSPATTLSASGLGGGTYFVRVRGRNACGSGAASNEVSFVIQ